MSSVLTGILNELCDRADMLFILVVIEAMLLLVSIGGLLAVDPNSASHVVWLLNIAGLAVLFLFSGSVLVTCYRRV